MSSNRRGILARSQQEEDKKMDIPIENKLFSTTKACSKRLLELSNEPEDLFLVSNLLRWQYEAMTSLNKEKEKSDSKTVTFNPSVIVKEFTETEHATVERKAPVQPAEFAAQSAEEVVEIEIGNNSSSAPENVAKRGRGRKLNLNACPVCHVLVGGKPAVRDHMARVHAGIQPAAVADSGRPE